MSERRAMTVKDLKVLLAGIPDDVLLVSDDRDYGVCFVSIQEEPLMRGYVNPAARNDEYLDFAKDAKDGYVAAVLLPQ